MHAFGAPISHGVHATLVARGRRWGSPLVTKTSTEGTGGSRVFRRARRPEEASKGPVPDHVMSSTEVGCAGGATKRYVPGSSRKRFAPKVSRYIPSASCLGVLSDDLFKQCRGPSSQVTPWPEAAGMRLFGFFRPEINHANRPGSHRTRRSAGFNERHVRPPQRIAKLEAPLVCVPPIAIAITGRA